MSDVITAKYDVRFGLNIYGSKQSTVDHHAHRAVNNLEFLNKSNSKMNVDIQRYD